jgi:NADPH-dependent 2,4-dienoyl-CoA reductase/sulfur reductase-like enzyme
VRRVTERIVIVGGDAAGMSAASQALRTASRRGRDITVTVLERGSWTSYSACGIPYWVAGDVDVADDLVARTPAEHRANGIDLHMGVEVTEIDLGARVVQTRQVVGTHESTRPAAGTTVAFDQLVIATGSVPIRPDLPGAYADGIHGLQTLDDGQSLLDALTSRRRLERAVVVGAGYIGIEVAEATQRRGLATTVVDVAEQPMTTLDPDMGALVRVEMEKLGIDLRTSTAVEGFEVGPDGWVSGVVTSDGTLPADLVVLGIGVRPNTRVAREAGLPLGSTGGLQVDRRQAVVGNDGIWAAGDCVESFHRVSQRPAVVALGTHANKQGRVLGTNLGGGYQTFPGVVGTAITKVHDLEIARTGLGVDEARGAGYDVVSGTVESTTTAGYMPGASPMTVKVIAEAGTARMLGAQIVGAGPGSAKRIDACALAVWNEMHADDLAMTDLSYAPPFSPVWDPVQIAARRAAERALPS